MKVQTKAKILVDLEVLDKVLEALENEHHSPRGPGYELSVYESRQMDAAITSLRAALLVNTAPTPRESSSPEAMTRKSVELTVGELAVLCESVPVHEISTGDLMAFASNVITAYELKNGLKK